MCNVLRDDAAKIGENRDNDYCAGLVKQCRADYHKNGCSMDAVAQYTRVISNEHSKTRTDTHHRGSSSARPSSEELVESGVIAHNQ